MDGKKKERKKTLNQKTENHATGPLRLSWPPLLLLPFDDDAEGRWWVRFGIVYVLFTGGVLQRPSGRHAVAMKDERTVKNYRPESAASHNTRREASV